MMKRRSVPNKVQRVFSFLEQAKERTRLFKLINIAILIIALVAIVGGTSRGRYLLQSTFAALRFTLEQKLGIPPNREAIVISLKLQRDHAIDFTKDLYQQFYDNKASDGLKHILDAAAMSPKDALFRWANVDWTVVLSSKVFEADDTGRAYRMRPNVRSFWMKSHSLPNAISSFFFLPDIPEVRSAMDAAGMSIMPESPQTTNSWGCRSSEPKLNADIRGLVLGDSYMQGIFVADDQTPAACLERALQSRWNRNVSILNTGHIGYSPEQYYHTLVEFFPRFKPHFVILSVCPNDFGDATKVMLGEGAGDWLEAQHWIGEIRQYCLTQSIPCFLVAAPLEMQVAGVRRAAFYPGRLTTQIWTSSVTFIDPVEAFVDESLRLKKLAHDAGKPLAYSPLFNGRLDDGHFSPLGCKLWADVVARRLDVQFNQPPATNH